MVLRLLDKLFTKETFLKSTLHGTKEFAALDSTKIAAIKGKLGKGTTKSPSRCSFNLSFNLTLIKPEVVCVQGLTGDRASHSVFFILKKGKDRKKKRKRENTSQMSVEEKKNYNTIISL